MKTEKAKVVGHLLPSIMVSEGVLPECLKKPVKRKFIQRPLTVSVGLAMRKAFAERSRIATTAY